jgi:hypothetical protein
MSGLGRFPRRASWPAATVAPGKADAKTPASIKIPYRSVIRNRLTLKPAHAPIRLFGA